MSKVYQCSYDECFSAVLDLVGRDNLAYDRDEWYQYGIVPEQGAVIFESEDDVPDDEKIQKVKEKPLDIFLEDKEGGRIVVMDVPGSINTTEVGIFFVPENISGRDGVQIDISSLSSQAKHRVADIVFGYLDHKFSVVENEPGRTDS